MSCDIKASGNITARCWLYWRQSRRHIRRAVVGAVEVVVLRMQVVNVFLSPCLRGLHNRGRHASGGCFALGLLVASYLSANTRALGCLIGGSIPSGARHRRRRRAVAVEWPRNIVASAQAQHQAASAQNTQTLGSAQRAASAPDRVSWVHRCEYTRRESAPMTGCSQAGSARPRYPRWVAIFGIIASPAERAKVAEW